jgi:hypothetical protein
MADPKALYDVLFQDKLYTKTYGEFIIQFAGDKAREELYTTLSSDKLYTKSLDEFNEQFFSVKKKEETTSEVSPKPSETFGEVQPPLPSNNITEKIDAMIANKEATQHPLIQPAESTSVPEPIIKPLPQPEEPQTLKDYIQERHVTPKILGLPKDMNLDRNLREGEKENFDDLLSFKGFYQKSQKPSYFWGTVKAGNMGTASFFRALDNASKTLSNMTGLPHGTGFADIADYIEWHVSNLPNTPNTRPGRALSNVAGLQGLFLELAITPEFKFKVLGKLAKVPKIITQQMGSGLVNRYAEAITKEEPSGKEMLEGLKGMGIGLKDGLILTGLGYTAGVLGQIAKTATKSGLASVVTSTASTAVGFGGATALEQLITNGEVDWKKVEEAFDIGLVLGIPGLAQYAGLRAWNNFITASPAAFDAAQKFKITPEDARKQAVDIRAKAKEETDVEKRVSMEAVANVMDALTDIKIVRNDVAQDPSKFAKAIMADDELTLPEKQFYLDQINEIAKENISTSDTKTLENIIKSTKEDLALVQTNKSLSEEARDAQVKVLNTQIRDKESVLGDIQSGKIKEAIEFGGEFFSTKKDAFKWLDENYSRKERLAATGEASMSNALGRKTFNEWYDINKEELAKEFAELGVKKEKVTLPKEEKKEEVPPKVEPKVEEIKPTEKVIETPIIGNWEKGEERPFAFDENSTKNEGRFRLFPPENIKKDTYFSRNSSTEGVRYIMGKTKDGKEIIQAIRFDKGRFTEEQAKNWFEKNKSKYKFYSTEKILIEPQITPKETVSPIKGEIVPPTEKVAETSIFVAPWESKKVKDFNDESGFKETQYKEFQDVLSKIAQSMGYPIKKTNRTIGGWFSGKEKIHEPSVGVVIPTQNQEDIDLFSSLAGALAPQTQNSVIRIRVKKGEVGDWTEITPKDIDAVNKITDKLKKLGFSLEKDNNKLYIGTQNINELSNLYEILEKNGTGITGIRTRQASVSFFDKGSYLPTLERYGDRSHRRYGGVGGENLYNYVTKATAKLRGEVKPPKVQEPSLKEREVEIKPAKGIKYQDKTYVSVEDIQEDFDKFESLQEYNKILEKVRKFEDGLKADAIKTSDETAKKLGIVDRVTEEKRLGEVNDRLNIKLLPDIPAIANDILYKQLVKVRDGLANTTANLLQKGMKSQNDILRWMSKFITNWWGGLGRTQADIHGKEGKIGKLEMKGTTQVFALYEAKQIRGKMLELVNDPESLRRVRDAYDLEIAEEKIKFEDLTIVEQNLYNLIKDWNTWVWSTNYALGIIPTESHLKYLDTENEGKSTYIARMYDKWEIDELPPEINEHITKGSNSVTTKMITDYLKARKEVDDWKKEHAITDPTYLTTKRIMQTIQNVAIKEYMDAVISEHPDFVLELKKGQEVPKGYKKLGSSWGWGQFRNKAVINHIVEDFTGFFYANKLTNVLYDALKLWDRNKINQFYKKFRTLYNPMVQLGNMTGDVFFASINGINPAEFLAEQITVLRDRVSKVDEDVYKSVLKSGLMGDVGITGDMTPPKESIKDLTTAKTSWGRIKEILHKGDELASDLYIGTDNVAKYAAYRVFRKRGFTHAQALRRAYDAFQNYMTVGKTWDVASKLPVIGPTFVKFQADLQRIITNAILTTPLTAIGTVMLIKLFGILTSHLSGESDEEREEREKRKGVAKIPIINVPLSFKIGKAELNGARYLSPLYIYKQEDSESDLAEFSKYLPLQFVKAPAPQLGERKNVIAFGDATWGWLGSVMADRDFRSISIRNPEATIFFNPNITTDQKIANVMNYVLRSQLPFYKSFEDITDGITGKLDYYGRKRTWYQAIMNGIIKIQEFDDPELKRYVESNIEYLTNKFAGLSEAMGDANALFLKELQKAEDLGISKEAMDKLYKVEDNRRAKNMEQSLKEQIPVLQEIERQVNVYKKWYPDDPFIKENFMNIEAGKNRIFDIKSDIDFQKKYKEEYNLLKKNGLIKKPDEIPTAYKGIKLNEEQRREYIATYWSEYVRYLDAKMGLTQENIDKYKSKITKTKKVKTKLEPEITTALDEKVSRAREEARDKAEKRLKQTIKNQ